MIARAVEQMIALVSFGPRQCMINSQLRRSGSRCLPLGHIPLSCAQ